MMQLQGEYNLNYLVNTNSSCCSVHTAPSSNFWTWTSLD